MRLCPLTKWLCWDSVSHWSIKQKRIAVQIGGVFVINYTGEGGHKEDFPVNDALFLVLHFWDTAKKYDQKMNTRIIIWNRKSDLHWSHCMLAFNAIQELYEVLRALLSWFLVVLEQFYHEFSGLLPWHSVNNKIGTKGGKQLRTVLVNLLLDAGPWI